MMFPKSKPRDPAAIRKIRKINHCEICGEKAEVLEVMHIISVGAGGPDMPENLLRACGPASLQKGCHGKSHMGKIKQEELWEKAARREGITPEECYRRVRRRMGYNVE